MSERRDRSRAWIDDPIRKNVLTMHLQRDAYIKVTGILAANTTLPDSYWWEFMVDTYIATQAMAVRRQSDVDKRVRALSESCSSSRPDHSSSRASTGSASGARTPSHAA
jgi:hypothetical protein